MIKPFYTSIICLFASYTPAQQEIRLQSKISKVQVYLSYASITHQTNTFPLNKGQQTVVIENVATSLLPNNIQIRGKGNFIILSSQFRKNYLIPKPISKKIQQLEDSLDYLKNKKENIDIQYKTLEDEENLILSNKNIGGQNTGVSAAELEKIATLYRTKLTEIRTKKSTLLPDIKKLNEKIQNIQNQLNELHAQKNKPTGEIIIHLYANENINNAQLEIEYVCNGVRWYPEYEIRVNELNKPLQFLMKAQITQNTGIDWENVSLTLSSSAPNLNHNKPELQPWYLYFQNIPQIKETYKSKMHRINDAAPLSDEKSLAAQEEAPSLKEAPTLPEYTLAYEKYTTQEYQIPIALNIPSGSKPARIDVYTFTADAKFSYYSAPKITEHAYLIADIRDWEKYNFMSGPLFIFIENTYIGQSEINPEITRDTFQVSLGIDQNISVKRQMIKKFNEKKIIGNARKEIRAYEISVKNKKSIPVEITIEDQIPLTSVQEIEVELLESSDAGYDKTTGKLSWKLILQPGEEKKLPFKYSVKYPKDKIINL